MARIFGNIALAKQQIQSFGEGGLIDLMTGLNVNSAQDIVQCVVNSVTDFRQTLPQQDDITVLALVNHNISKSSTG